MTYRYPGAFFTYEKCLSMIEEVRCSGEVGRGVTVRRDGNKICMSSQVKLTDNRTTVQKGLDYVASIKKRKHNGRVWLANQYTLYGDSYDSIIIDEAWADPSHHYPYYAFNYMVE